MKKCLIFSIVLLASLVIVNERVWGQAAVNTVMWSETWTNATTASSASDDATPSSNCSSSKGTTVYNNGTVTYTQSSNAVYIRTDSQVNSGGNNLLLAKNNGTWTVSGIPTGSATELTLSYGKGGSGTLNITTSTSGASISGSTITTGGASTIALTFKNTSTSSNLRLDDISVKVKTAGSGSANTYLVTYNANGATSGSVPTDATAYASNATVTVKDNTGSLTKTGYTFGGWNTAADGTGTDRPVGSTFAISANTTLYAKWNAKTITGLSSEGTPTKTTYNAGEIFNPAGLTVTATFNDNSSEDVTASVSWTPSPLTAGTTSVTGTYLGQTIIVNGLTVNAAPGADAEHPYTVAQAISNTPSSGTSNDVYIHGFVSGFYGSNDDILDDTYHRYYISDDGTTTDQLLVYNGKGLNNVAFSNVNDLLIGDEVIIKGGLTTFSNAAEIAKDNYIVSLVRNPSITATPSPLTVPSYVAGTADPTYETLTVNGNYLTANITLSLGVSSDFELSTDLSSWSSSLTLTQSNGSVTNEEVAVRLKAGLAKGSHNGTLTLSSEGATDVTVNLSGSVTGQTYSINVDDQITGGSIEADPTSAEEGATVTLTADPDDAYTFGSWTVLKDDLETSIAVADNQFTMPSCAVYVSATFNAKPTYEVTCVANPVAGGTIVADENAYEGKSVTIECEANSGYELSSIVIKKTSDGSATNITPTASGDDYTFTMPGFAVTVTASFTHIVSWDLSSASYSSSSTSEVDWTSSYASVSLVKGESQSNANNYLGSTNNNHTRFYQSQVLTFTPASGYRIIKATITAVSGYATGFTGNSWTNATTSTSNSIITVTPTNTSSAFGVTISAACRATEIKVYYEAMPTYAPIWSSLPDDATGTVGTEYTLNLKTYVSANPAASITVTSSTADPLLYSVSDGVLHFTPNAAGDVSFTFKAENTQGSSEANMTIAINAAADVTVPVLSVDEANVSSNTAMVSWSSCTGVSSYTLQLASDNKFSDGTDAVTLVENAATSGSAPSGWTYGLESYGSAGFPILYKDEYIITEAFNTSSYSSLTLYLEIRTFGGTDGDSDKVSVQYTTDNGSSWSTSMGTITATGKNMSEQSLSINSAAGKTSVRLRIISQSTNTSKGVGIQNIAIKGTSSGNGSILSESSVSGNSITFKDLSAGTTYYARVKGAETWSNIVTFTTEAATPATKELTIIASVAKYNGRYWTTFYDSSNGYKLPAGAQAFKLVDNKLVLLGDSGVVIPKETPVVIVSDKASLTLTQTNATVTVGDNDLVGSATAVTVTEGKVDGKIPHVLSIKGSPTAVIGFYKFTGSEIPAGKAYVLVSE